MAKHTEGYNAALAKYERLKKAYKYLAGDKTQLLSKKEQLEKVIENLAGDKAKMEKILAYYDNPHTPPSKKSATLREIVKIVAQKKERKKKTPQGAARVRLVHKYGGKMQGNQDRTAQTQKVWKHELGD